MPTMTFGKMTHYGTGGGAILILRDAKRVGHIHKTMAHDGKSWKAHSYQVHWNTNQGPSATFLVSDHGKPGNALLAAKEFAQSANKRRRKW